ncbi:hypothetical protein LX36DRAFT_208708 [Colletotrichum falcatum]|nr:hypothetical protein LX36DRAFT_208708 [Colletotrichum falcatum]
MYYPTRFGVKHSGETRGCHTKETSSLPRFRSCPSRSLTRTHAHTSSTLSSVSVHAATGLHTGEHPRLESRPSALSPPRLAARANAPQHLSARLSYPMLTRVWFPDSRDEMRDSCIKREEKRKEKNARLFLDSSVHRSMRLAQTVRKQTTFRLGNK